MNSDVAIDIIKKFMNIDVDCSWEEKYKMFLPYVKNIVLDPKALIKVDHILKSIVDLASMNIAPITVVNKDSTNSNSSAVITDLFHMFN